MTLGLNVWKLERRNSMPNKKELICNNCGGKMEYHKNEEILIPVGDKNKKEIVLKEGEEIKIKAEKGNSEQYMIVTCIKNCILKKSEAEAIKNGKIKQ